VKRALFIAAVSLSCAISVTAAHGQQTVQLPEGPDTDAILKFQDVFQAVMGRNAEQIDHLTHGSVFRGQKNSDVVAPIKAQDVVDLTSGCSMSGMFPPPEAGQQGRMTMSCASRPVAGSACGHVAYEISTVPKEDFLVLTLVETAVTNCPPPAPPARRR